MRKINERCYRTYNAELDENTIQHYMMTMKADLDDEYLELMKEELQQYADGVYNSLMHIGIKQHIQLIPLTDTAIKRNNDISAFDQPHLKKRNWKNEKITVDK